LDAANFLELTFHISGKCFIPENYPLKQRFSRLEMTLKSVSVLR